MNIFWAIFLGLVQGLTEFFPVSSSAHLALFPYIFKFPDPGLAFDVALHAGTLLAILFALWRDWVALLKGLIKKDASSKKLILFILITTIPGALAGYLFEERIATVFRAPLLNAGLLLVFGLILWFVDNRSPQRLKVKDMNASKALTVGLSQALALVPGVSRSGATITAGRALGFDRESAVKYSFMAALPIIAGATVFGLRDIAPSTLFSPLWIVGFLASTASSLWAIKFLTKYVKNHNFNLFLYYRVGLAGLVFLLYLIRR